MDDMIWKPEDIKIKDENGNYLSGNDAIAYINKNNSIIVDELLNVGDIIKLKKFKEQLVVKTNNGDLSKYEGYVPGMENELILFNQKDIEAIISKKR